MATENYNLFLTRAFSEKRGYGSRLFISDKREYDSRWVLQYFRAIYKRLVEKFT